jgi:hypothetical protein
LLKASVRRISQPAVTTLRQKRRFSYPARKSGHEKWLRRDELDLREIRAVAPWIAGQEGPLRDFGVGADKEIGQDSGSWATRGSVAAERLSCHEQSMRRRAF